MTKTTPVWLAALVGLGLAGCSANEPTNESGGRLTATDAPMCTSFPTSVVCGDWVVTNVVVSTDGTELMITDDAEGDFLIASEDIHAGLDFPATAGGDFDVAAFPFHYDYGTPRERVEHRFPLADLGAACGDTLSMAVHVVAVRLDASGAVIETKEGFAMSEHAYGSGYCFYYDTCCPAPTPDAGTSTCDAGTPETDAGTPETDAGTPEADAGTTGGTCTLTQGYWKNHPDDWPVGSLTIGGDVYTEAELLVLLDTPPRGDASLILAHQLIAAMLNVEAGASAPAALADARAFLTANQDATAGSPSATARGAARPAGRPRSPTCWRPSTSRATATDGRRGPSPKRRAPGKQPGRALYTAS